MNQIYLKDYEQIMDLIVLLIQDILESSNIVPFTSSRDLRIPGYTDVHLYNHVSRRGWSGSNPNYTENDSGS